MMATAVSLPWPDLAAPKDSRLQTRLILQMRPALRETLCDGLWRGALERQRARKGQPPLFDAELAPDSVCPPLDESPIGRLLWREARHLAAWAMEVLEAPTSAFTSDGRHTLLMLIVSRMSWLDGLLARAYGERRALCVWDEALAALLPDGGSRSRRASDEPLP